MAQAAFMWHAGAPHHAAACGIPEHSIMPLHVASRSTPSCPDPNTENVAYPIIPADLLTYLTFGL